MSDESCTCGCNSKPEAEKAEECTCGCGTQDTPKK
jgi:hypothetical protein